MRLDREGSVLETLYGSVAPEEKCVAYCRYHKVYLTVKQIKRHRCLLKQCPRLEKRAHPWWGYREMLKQKRKERKQNGPK